MEILTVTGAQPALGADFADACTAVLAYLDEHLPLRTWMVSRISGDDFTLLHLRDGQYGAVEGMTLPFDEQLCCAMVEGTGPHVAADVDDVPAMATRGARDALPINAYVGVPLRTRDGELFGTLCGVDATAQGDDLSAHEPLLHLLATLLGSSLASDRRMTELERAAERARDEAMTDPLTRLLNRRGWDHRVEAEVARARRLGDPLCVVLGDLDGLKRANDRYGHAAGDARLRDAARILADRVGEDGVVARLGGDEFAVLLPGVTDHRCRALVDQLAAALDDAEVPMSLGWSAYRIGDGVRDTMQRADRDMYEQKAARRLRRTPAV